MKCGFQNLPGQAHAFSLITQTIHALKIRTNEASDIFPANQCPTLNNASAHHLTEKLIGVQEVHVAYRKLMLCSKWKRVSTR